MEDRVTTQDMKPKHGDRRVIKRFLWFPHTIMRETRWLRTVYIEQEYYEFWLKRSALWIDLRYVYDEG